MMASSRRRVVAVFAGLALAAGFSPPAQSSNDPYFAKQWGLIAIGAPAAWARTTGAGVRIGIVDTGVDLAHEDLVGHVVESTSCLNTDGNTLSSLSFEISRMRQTSSCPSFSFALGAIFMPPP